MTDTAPAGLSAEQVCELDRSYFERRRCSPQWRGFLAALATELHTGTEPDEVRGFMRHVGRRMAEDLVLPKVETLAELEAAMNVVWDRMDWGWVRLFAEPGAIRVVHGAYPDVMADPNDKVWPGGASAVLEGIYSCWFERQGSPGGRTTRSGAAVDPLEFRHG